MPQAGFIRGKKTYILAIVAVITGLANYAVGDMGLMDALNYIWAGGVAAALRAGVDSVKS